MTPPASFTEAQDVFAAKLPGYTRRPHQIALAEKVEESVADGGILLAQAGTGTGKSFALLISVILAGKRTVVAVPTKALQDQYVGDLTFLEENLGADFKWAILKGRSNYPCWVKSQAVQAPTRGQREVLELMAKNADPREGQIIDRESFPALTRQEWAPFSMSADECPGATDCPFAAQCFTERAKSRAAGADVVVTNLAYLLQDLRLRLATADNVVLLGEIEQLVIDEAHMLPEAVTSALEDTMSEFTFKVLARDLAGYLYEHERDEQLATDIEAATERLWERLVSVYLTWAKGDPRVTEPMALTVPQLISADGFSEQFIGLYQAIEAARGEVKATRPSDERDEMVRARLMRRTAGAMQRIADYTMDPPGKTVRWAEPEDRVIRGERVRRYSLRSAPVDIGPFLRATIWDKIPAVLSSATLAAGKDFTPLMELMGLSAAEATTYDAGSPFDFQRQALLFVPGKDMPDPKAQPAAWKSYAQAVTQHLVTRSGGGALLLFTSRSAMRDSHEALAPGFRAAGLHVMIQDGDTPTSQLVKAMKEDGNAVLFALRTFFQGIDIQGRSLRLVVIDKLPFPVPSDLVYKAREDALIHRHNDKWAGFTRLMIPSMILDLTQAAGRLIRHRDDFGVVAILDSRLSSKRYGAQIIRALPPATLTHDAEEAADFLEAAWEPTF
jgi:ATP-dependent DNA helicase DinG